MKQPPLSPDDFQALVPTDTATLQRLHAYLELLVHWQRRINLVGATTLADPWRRHILDSAQLLPRLPDSPTPLFDLGSGAGLPGLVLSILSRIPTTLVDSDARKCAFLREAARLTDAPVVVCNQRIEALPAASARVITARALSPLDRLLPVIAPKLQPDGLVILLKGRRIAEELTLASKAWKMRAHTVASLSDPDGCVVTLQEIEPRHDP